MKRKSYREQHGSNKGYCYTCGGFVGYGRLLMADDGHDYCVHCYPKVKAK